MFRRDLATKIVKTAEEYVVIMEGFPEDRCTYSSDEGLRRECDEKGPAREEGFTLPLSLAT